MVYLVTYDLNAPGKKDYKGIEEAIEACSTGHFFSCWSSTYLIHSFLTVKDITKRLVSILNENDTLLVIEVKNNFSGVVPPGYEDRIINLFG